MNKAVQYRTVQSVIFLLLLLISIKGKSQIKPGTAILVGGNTGNTTPNLPVADGSGTGNYIRVWDAQQGFTTDAAVTSSTNAFEVNRSTQYFDGLGRPLQTVKWKVSPNQKDIVAPIVYDAYGREQYKYLPYASTENTGDFRTNPFGEQKTFYGTTYKTDQPALNGEQFYYSHTQFESSPLNRIVKTFAPGNSWAGSEVIGTNRIVAEKAVSIQYLINNENDHVRIWDVGFDAFADGNNIPTSAATLPAIREYAVEQLFKTVTLDEHNNTIVEYKDKEDKVVLKKVQIGTIAADYSGYSGFLNTFYVYDDLGQLRFVIPPKAVAKMIEAQNWTLTTAIVNELCFRYEYDDHQRMKAKKVPGAAWVFMVYDKRDRLCFTQDGNLRNKQQWMYTLYEDDLNRPVETGIVKYPGSWTDLTTSAGATTNNANVNLLVPSRVNTISSYTATNSIEFGVGFTSEDGANFTAEIVKALSYSSQTGSPGATLSGGTWYPLTYTYYDNYSFGTTKSYSTVNNTQLNDEIGNTALTLETLPSTASTMIKGMVTGTRVRIIENPDNFEQGGWLETVSYYDDKGRVVQVQSDNYKGGKDIVTNRYNFTNKVTASYMEHSNPVAGVAGSNSLGVKTSILYDHAGRVTKTTKKVNYQTSSYTRTISENIYDALGQLKNKKIGQKSATDVTAIENDQYSYNIRGWLKGVNYYNSTTYTYGSQENSGNNKWFAFDLGYDWGFENGAIAANQYNGNIAGMRWMSAGDGKERAYGYSYDQANRLLKGDFTQYNSSWGIDPVLKFDVEMGNGTAGSAYDENGNIKQMQQWGLAGVAKQQIDNLVYTYASGDVSNKLLKVKDNAVQPSVNIGDFNNKNTADNDDYGYDVNGNLIADKNKGMNGATGVDQVTAGAVIYNHLNLPYQIMVKNDDGSQKGTITYIYDASGNKLEKRIIEGAKQTQTAYLSGFSYENNKLQFFGHEEGRVRMKQSTDATGQPVTSFVFDYFLKDHLGNVRTVLTDEVRQDIYPAATLETQGLETEKLYYNIVDDQWTITPKSSIPGFLNAANNSYPNNNNNNNPVNNNPNSNTSAISDKLYKLNGEDGVRVGLGTTLKVMAGDNVKILGKSYYLNSNPSQNEPDFRIVVSDLLNLFGGTNVFTGKGITGAVLNASTSIPGQVSTVLSNVPTPTIKPKANLNWILFDEQFKPIASNSSFDPVGNSGEITDHLKSVNITTNGYLYVYCSNESSTDVYFDNVQVVHNRGPLLEETHYYPFGLVQAGISSKAAGGLENKRGFQGKELQSKEFSDGSGLELYDFGAREQDPQIGRWWTIDPKAEKYYSSSPYNFVDNNPISRIDPTGKDWFYYQGKGEEKKTWHYQEGHKATYTNVKGVEKTMKHGYSHLVTFKATGTNSEGAKTGSLTVYNQNKAVVTVPTTFTGGVGGTNPTLPGTYIMNLSIRDDKGPQKMNAAKDNPEPAWGIQRIVNRYINASGEGTNNTAGGYDIQGAYGRGRIRLLETDGDANGDGNILVPQKQTHGYYLHGKLDAHNITHGCVCDKSEAVFNYFWGGDGKNVQVKIPFSVE